jgi:hypothetical protein
MREMGAALVAWSAVENEWSKIFAWLLFHERRKPAGISAGDSQPSPEDIRAYALWDALNNSAAQLDLVTALAPLILAKPEQEKGLRYLLKLAQETHAKRGMRNAIAHGPFEYKWGVPLIPSATGFAGPQELGLGDRPHKHMRDKDPHDEVPRIRDKFDELRTDVSRLRFWLLTGAWIGEDPTSEEKSPPPPKVPKASRPRRDRSKRPAKA